MARAFLVPTLILTALGGCGIDALLFTELTRGDQQRVPGAGNNFIVGRASALGGGSVAFFSATGAGLEDLASVADADGNFTATLGASTEYTNLVVTVESATRGAWGLVPRVPGKTSVLDPDQTIALGQALPEMGDLNTATTTYTLVLLAGGRYRSPPVPLSTLSPGDTAAAVAELQAKLVANEPALVTLRNMLQRLEADGATTAPALRPFPDAGASYLDLSALGAETDYDGDGVADASTEAFDEALAAAVEAISAVNACFPTDAIRLVIMVDFNGGQDRNCAEIDSLKWTKDEPGRKMFITGGIHADNANCETSGPPCLTPERADAFSQQMGNWVPNVAPMYDDATHGDLLAGDNVWTRAWDAPWYGSNEGAAVRISYKFTWGRPGQLWTTTEEWPGNSRLLEIRDLNEDGIVTRYDIYGDETTNKDKANLRSPKKFGCGSLTWSDEPPLKEDCFNDTRENRIDTDQDCELDTWPSPGAASPLTIPCAQRGELEAGDAPRGSK